nr:zinc finger protein 226-like [Penaeus vannamei]
MRIHTKEKPYICEICNKAFPEKGSLVKHMRVHTKEKPYICDICNKGFSQKCYLEVHTRKYNPVVHLRVHAKEKPCSYKICNKHFSDKSVLMDQSAEHAEDKPFMYAKSESRRHYLGKKEYSGTLSLRGSQKTTTNVHSVSKNCSPIQPLIWRSLANLLMCFVTSFIILLLQLQADTSYSSCEILYKICIKRCDESVLNASVNVKY